jgi:hypothetical protein
MSGYRKWRDTDHLDRAVDTTGGPDDFDREVQRMRDEARGWRLADLRKRRRLSRAEVARRMGISVSRSPRSRRATCLLVTSLTATLLPLAARSTL